MLQTCSQPKPDIYCSLTHMKQAKDRHVINEMVFSKFEMIGKHVLQLNSRYELSSITPNYKDYLGHFGVPSLVIPLMLASRETIRIKDFNNGTFSSHLTNCKLFKLKVKIAKTERKHFFSI